MTTQRTFTSEEAQKKFEALPEAVKDMLYSAELTAIIQKVGEKNKLHYDQMGRLEIETHNVLLGFTDTEDYAPILMKTLEVDQGTARTITEDMNELLFSKIREDMKQATTAASMPEKISNPPAMSAPAMPEKSVVMPSAAKAPVPAVTTPVPTATPSTPAVPAPSVPEIIKPVGMPMMQHVDAMLSQPTVSIAPKPVAPASTPAPATMPPVAATTPAPDVKKSDVPAPPPIYKTDPYHEPID